MIGKCSQRYYVVISVCILAVAFHPLKVWAVQGNTSGPNPGTPPPAVPSGLSIFSLQFKSDHPYGEGTSTLMTDNSDPINDNGSHYPKPEWSAVPKPGYNNPTSHNMRSKMQVLLDLYVDREAAEGSYRLGGTSQKGLVFPNMDLKLTRGPNLFMATSQNMLPRQISDYVDTIHWTLARGQGDPSPWKFNTGPHTLYLTWNIPRDTETEVNFFPDGHTDIPNNGEGYSIPSYPYRVTQARLTIATQRLAFPTPEESHVVIQKLVAGQKHSYGTNNYAQPAGAWVAPVLYPKTTNDHTTGYDCATISQLTKNIAYQVGLPGTVTIAYIYACPSVGHGRQAIERDNVGVDLSEEVNPVFRDGLWYSPVLVGHSGSVNNFEGCVEYAWTDRKGVTLTRYYPGGTALELSSAQDVLRACFYGLLFVHSKHPGRIDRIDWTDSIIYDNDPHHRRCPLTIEP